MLGVAAVGGRFAGRRGSAVDRGDQVGSRLATFGVFSRIRSASDLSTQTRSKRQFGTHPTGERALALQDERADPVMFRYTARATPAILPYIGSSPKESSGQGGKRRFRFKRSPTNSVIMEDYDRDLARSHHPPGQSSRVREQPSWYCLDPRKVCAAARTAQPRR